MARFLRSRIEGGVPTRSLLVRFVIVSLIIGAFFVMFNPFKTPEERRSELTERVLSKMREAPATAPIEAQPSMMERSGEVFGTKVIFRAISADSNSIQNAADALFKDLVLVRDMLDAGKGDSPLYKVNSSAGDGNFVEVPEEFYRLVERCMQLSERTHGYFDITLGPIWKRWNFDQLKPVILEAKEAEALLPLVGYDKVELKPEGFGVRLKKDNMELDFRPVIRAYALERARVILKEKGISDYIMFIGGDAIVSGSNMGNPWSIVMQHPRKAWNYFGVMTFDQPAGMISQADFRHFFISKGFRYHDLLDPKTAAPVQKVRVATTVMDDLVAAAALTYAVHVQGHKEGLKLAEEWGGVPLLVQDVWNHNHWNEAMKKYFVEKEGSNLDLPDVNAQKQ